MKVLLLYDYPPSPGGLSTQGQLLHKGLEDMGVEVFSVNYESAQEKEWYYRWFEPDVVLGVGYWGYTPHLVLHPQRFGIQPIPWLVANGYLANYNEILEDLPLILVTSNWVKTVYMRDGLSGNNIEVLPVGCDTDSFIPRDKSDPNVAAVRDSIGIKDDEIMILTIGGDATSKGAQEVMHALAISDTKASNWKYVCKVWPQARTNLQNAIDLQLANHLGIGKKVTYTKSVTSRNFMPYLLAACDIYAAPSRIEGFGMIQVEANACGKPVIGIKAMGMLDTMVHRENALLASVAQEVRLREQTLGTESGYRNGQKIIFKRPRTVDYRASIHDIANYLVELMEDEELRNSLGHAGRERAVEYFDYRVVAKKFVEIVSSKLGIN